MDGEIDYPADPECITQGDRVEMPDCANYTIAEVVFGEGGSYEFTPEENYEGIEVSCGFSAGQEAVYAIYVDELSQPPFLRLMSLVNLLRLYSSTQRMRF